MKFGKCDELRNLNHWVSKERFRDILEHVQEKAKVMAHKTRGGIQINARVDSELWIDGEQP